MSILKATDEAVTFIATPIGKTVAGAGNSIVKHPYIFVFVVVPLTLWGVARVVVKKDGV